MPLNKETKPNLRRASHTGHSWGNKVDPKATFFYRHMNIPVLADKQNFAGLCEPGMPSRRH